LTSLNDEQWESLKAELTELYEWKRIESEKLEADLRKEGKWVQSLGLDVNQHYFSDIVEEFQRRFYALGVKYGILSEKDQHNGGKV